MPSQSAHLACRVSQNVYFRTVRGFPERCFSRVHILFMLSCFFRVYSARGGRRSTSVFVLLFKCCEHTWWRENVSKGELKCFQCSQIQKLPSFLRKKQTQCQSTHLPGSAVSLQSDTSTGTAQSKCPFGRKSEEHWLFIYSVNTTVWTCMACQSLGCWTTQNFTIKVKIKKTCKKRQYLIKWILQGRYVEIREISLKSNDRGQQSWLLNDELNINKRRRKSRWKERRE